MQGRTELAARAGSYAAQLMCLAVAACGGEPAQLPAVSGGIPVVQAPAVAGSPAQVASTPTMPSITMIPAATGTAGSAATPAPVIGKPVMTPAPAAAGTAAMAPPPTAGTAAAPTRLPASLYDSATGTLRPPAAGDGVQVTTPMFDLQPGQERFACFHTEIPIDGEFYVHYYESKMANGSHHFILYKNDADMARLGTMDTTGCLTAFQSWIYSSAQPHIDLRMPEGVAMVLNSRQRVMFDMHYINTGDKTLHAQVALNVVLAKGKFEKAASLISFNTGIRIPPHGTQTVTGDCTPGQGAKFFYMLTHTHRRGKLATITRLLANGMPGEELVRSTDWEVPMERKWLDEPLMTFQPGEKFRYSCEYQNDLEQVVTAGASAQINEMCMAITYYFPASAGGSCR